MASGAAWPVEPPTAGSLSRELAPRPAPAPDGGAPVLRRPAPVAPAASAPSARFTLKALRISGARTFSEAQLLPLVSDLVGQDIDLDGLEQAAARLTDHYQRRGYLLARAYVPAQQIRDGVVEIAVVESHYGRITVNGDRLARLPLLPLGALAEGAPVANGPLERSLLLLSDLSGGNVQATLQPGDVVGSTDLLIEMGAARRVTASAELDNFGARSTGQARLNGKLDVGNLARVGDALSAQGLASGERLRYASLAYQLPVNRFGTRAGLAWSGLRYRLGAQFAGLEANGSARSAGLFVSHPLLRSRNANFSLKISRDDKRQHDRIERYGIVTDKAVRAWSAAVSGDARDGTGSSGVVLSYSAGRLTIASPGAREVDAVTARSEGAYGKLGLTAWRVQALGPATSLYASYSAQWANRNLDSSEKFAAGGAYGVRAYPPGEAAADQARLLTLELRRALAANWQGLLFYDAAQLRVNHTPWPGGEDGARRLVGAGAGLNWNGPDNLAWRAYYARKLGAGSAETDRAGRWYFQLSKVF